MSEAQGQSRTDGSSSVPMWTGTQSTPPHRSVLRKAMIISRSSSTPPLVQRATSADKFDKQIAQNHCLCAAAVRAG